MIFYIEGLLSGGDLERAQRLARSADYVSGRATADVGTDVKHNVEMGADETYLELVEVLERAVDASTKVQHRLLPRHRTRPIINRYDAGMYFREHVDAPIQGGRNQFGKAPGRFGQSFMRTDYSMTLFLTPPEAYDGGELELVVDERRELVKLPAGSAVCYQTGISHSVRAVVRGSRICAIFWFQSLIRDAALRRTIWELHCVAREIDRSGHGELAERARSIEHNFVRYLADV